jgi:chromosomal replication initiation ATPase DnaA
VPPAWAVRLPDLRSRLAASAHAVIQAPDDALVRVLLARLFERRGLDARADLVEWIAGRIERSHLAVIRAVDALDQEAMERRKRLSIPFARITLVDAGILPPPPTSEDPETPQ